MAVGGGGACGRGFVRNRYFYAGDQPAKFAVLPYKRGWAVRTDGAGNVGYEIYKARWDKSKPIGGEAVL